MKQLNNKAFRKILKSHNPNYDKEAIWVSIDAELDKRKNRRIYWLLLLIGVFSLSFIAYYYAIEKSKSNHTVLIEDNLDQNEPALTVEKEIKTKHITNSEFNSKLEERIPNKSIKDKFSKNEIDNYSNNRIQPAKSPTLITKTSKNQLSISNQKNDASQKRTMGKIIGLEKTLNAIPPLVQSLKQRFNDRVYSTNSDKNVNSIQPISLHPTLLDPLAYKSENKKSFLVTGFISQPSSSILGLNPEGQIRAELKESLITDLYSTGLSAQFSWGNYKNIEILTGVRLNRSTQRFNYSGITSSTKIIKSDSAEFYQYFDGTTSYFAGEIIETTENMLTVQQYNHTYSLGLTLGLHYEINLGAKWGVFGRSNYVFNPLVYSTGKMLNQENTLVSLRSQDYSRNISVHQINLQSGIVLNLKKSNSLYFGIDWTNDLNSRSLENNISEKLRAFGLGIGFRRNI